MLEEIIGIVVAFAVVVSEATSHMDNTSDVQQASLSSPTSCDIQDLQRTLDVGTSSELQRVYR